MSGAKIIIFNHKKHHDVASMGFLDITVGILNMLNKRINKVVSLIFLGRNTGHHLTRYYMYRSIRSSCSNLCSPSAKVLSISNSQEIVSLLGLGDVNIYNACYPEYDILSLPFEDESFDLVVSDQVLEHINGNPQIAINETNRVLRKGGVAIHTTCFMNPIHEHPVDLWRFTPACLAYLHRDWSKIIECAGWGNPLALLFMMLGLRMMPIPNEKWHPMHKIATFNSRSLPIVTWVAAIK